MRRIAVALLLLASSSWAQESLLLRTQVRPEREVWVGERTSLYVTVLMDGRPDYSPRFDLPLLEGALLRQAPGSPLLGTEKLSGVEYTSQRYELMLFAQREGAVQVPAIDVRVGLGGEELRAATEALQVRVRRPEGVAPGAPLITTAELEIQQTWEPQPADARVGDAFRRTISIRARNVLGVAIPPAPLPSLAGLAIHTAEPTVEDVLQRGALTSTRIDVVTLVCESPGHFEIPELVYRWWNPDRQRLEEQRLPGVAFEVVATPVAALPGKLDESVGSPVTAWIAGGLLGLGALGLWLARSFLERSWSQWRERHQQREPATFRRLLSACHSADPAAAWPALVAWIDRLQPGTRTASVSEFARGCGSPELTHESEVLQRALLEGRADWSGRSLAAALKRVRRDLHARGARAADLPALNP